MTSACLKTFQPWSKTGDKSTSNRGSMVNTKLVITAFVMALLTPVVGHAQKADPKWTVAPYLWGPSISLDTSSTGGGSDISLSDLLEKIDSVGMLHMEWRPSRFGLVMDYMFLGLSDSDRIQLLPPPEPAVFVNADIDLTVLELGGFFRQEGDADNGFDWLLGLRNIQTDQLVLVTPDVQGGVTRRIESDANFTDVYAGARVVWLMGESWPLSLRADVGGGDSEGTVNFVGTVSYMFPIRYHIGATLGYRYTKLKLRDTTGDEIVDSELTLSGPMLGFVFKF